MKLRSVIIDDEDLARKNLSIMLENHCPEIEIIGEAGTINEAERIIKDSQPDVIFLDIRMPSGTEGFDLLERLESRNFLVVFVTAFKDYAIKAFQANAAHYILKPIDEDDLRNAIDKITATKEIFKKHPENYSNYFEVLQNLADRLVRNKSSNKIAISHTKGVKIIDDNTITHVEASGNCSTLYFKDDTRYLDTRTLKVYEGILDKNKFFRIHKSYIINLNMIKEYVSEDGYSVLLKNDVMLPVARSRVSDFLKTIKGEKK